MPRFSICVCVYNGKQYLPACLNSILLQSFSDFEVIVVDDASTDGSSTVVSEYAVKDSRVKPVFKKKNEGLHLGHRTAIDYCSGEYVLFLDADDEFAEGLLEHVDRALREEPVDMLHFGISVIGEGVSDEACRSFEAYVNQPIEPLENLDIVSAIFGGCGKYRQDWRVPQRAFSANLLRAAFSQMPRKRLDCAEDAYEMFIISTMAKRQITHNDIIGIQYHLGRGLNGSSSWGKEKFVFVAKSFWDCYAQIAQYAKAWRTPSVANSADRAKIKLMQLLFNDWRARVLESEKLQALEEASTVLGPGIAGSEAMRCTRDAAYEKLTLGIGPSSSTLNAWFDAARRLAEAGVACSVDYAAYLSEASNHISAIREAERASCFSDQRVRIFVSTHKPVERFDSDILQPVQVGSLHASERYSWALHDDEGENISNLNPMYCELTTQYWAWKNVDADYIGFCHYRRYFDFSDTAHKENAYGEVMDDYIDAVAQEEYKLDDTSIASLVKNYDVVTTPIEDIRSYMGNKATIRSQYDAADRLYVDDLDKVVNILVSQHPDYEQDARAFLAGHTGRFCNMFIMKRDIFRDYCAWLFPILEEFCRTADMGLYSKEGVRTPGHLAERLLNIYLLHNERIGANWKTKQLQCVHFVNPEKQYLPVAMASGSEFKPVIPVAFAASNNYVPMLVTTIHSMLSNASSEYRYDIVVLHKGITWEKQECMRAFFCKSDNVALQFCDVSRVVAKYDLTTNNPHISIETYYRFLIQELLPYYNKVLYLDSDLIVKGDVSELFKVDLGDNLLAAVRDVDYCGNLNMKDGIRMRYTKEVLGMRNPYDYFQAGVLVLNTKAMRKLHPMRKWLEFASDDRFIYNDQDVLIAHCEGRVTFLDYDWNVMTDCFGRIGRIFAYAPAAIFDAFNDSRNHEKIVHYAGAQKPWKVEDCDRFSLYWEYAKDTPFYENLLMILAKEVSRDVAEEVAHPTIVDEHKSAVSENNPLRKIVDPIMPMGSRRREVLKAVARKVRGLD